jgi:hypothetical protein
MSLNRYAARTDSTQADIIKALTKVGAKVWKIKWPVDLLVTFKGLLYGVECKRDDKAKLTKDQQEFFRHCGAMAVRANTPEEALRGIGAI